LKSKNRRIRRVKHWQTALAILWALSPSLTLADDFKTVNGKEYKNVTVSRVEPDGIVLKTKSGISKLYFTELPKEVQERFHYNPANVAAQSRENANVAETSGIEGLPPISIELKDQRLNALKMTDKLDALYKSGCSSGEFVAAAVPIEGVFMKLHKQLSKGDPRRDLFANTFEAYQQVAVAMKRACARCQPLIPKATNLDRAQRITIMRISAKGRAAAVGLDEGAALVVTWASPLAWELPLP
jgi:hypothetical protein